MRRENKSNGLGKEDGQKQQNEEVKEKVQGSDAKAVSVHSKRIRTEDDEGTGDSKEVVAEATCRSNGNSKRRKKRQRVRERTQRIDPMMDELWVDWDQVARGRWGQESLFRFLPYPYIGTLVGWATHVVSNSYCTWRPTEEEQQNQNQERERLTRSIIAPNPLAGLGNDPFRPSILGWIHERASKVVWDLPGTPLVRPSHSSPNGVAVAAKNRQKESNVETKNCSDGDGKESLWRAFDISALVTIGMLLEESMTAILLPLARRHVQRCRSLEIARDIRNTDCKKETPSNPAEPTQERICDDDYNDHHHKHIHDAMKSNPESATCREDLNDWPPSPHRDQEEEEEEKVAVEEEKTRRLSRSHDQIALTERGAVDDDPFIEWTLPPEEALEKLLRKETEGCHEDLPPTTRCPTRTINADTVPNPSVPHSSSSLEPQQTTVNQNVWIQAYRLFHDQRVIEANKDL